MRKFALILIVVAAIVLVPTLLFLGYRMLTQGEVTTENVELVYWGLWEDETFIQPIIDQYEQEHPNVTIKYTQKSFTQYETILDQRLADGTGPDIFRIHNTWVVKFEDSMVPLPDTVMNSADYATNFYDTAQTDFTGSNGQLYAIPLEIDGLGMYVNNSIMESSDVVEVPQDWEEFREAAKKMTKTDSSGNITVAGAAIGTANNINHSFDLFSVLMLQNGVTMTQDDQAAFQSSRGVDAIDFYTGFALTDQVWSSRLGNDLEMFSQGKLGIMFAPSWRVFDVKYLNEDLDFDIYPIPQIPSSQNTPVVNWASYWGEAVSAKCQHPDIAWDFVRYLSEKENLQSMYTAASNDRVFGEPYSRKDMANLLQHEKYVGAYIEMAPTAKTWDMIDQGVAEEVLLGAVNEVITGTNGSERALLLAAEAYDEDIAEFLPEPELE